MARVSGIVRPAAVAAVACCAALAAAAAGARAAPGPGAESGYSAYELETLRAQLGQRRAELDPAPEGKVVEAVDVCVLDVIEERDPAPNFLNWFHATSREGVIRRELLLRAGQRYRQDLADETARNLRGLRQLSLVLLAPLRAARPDRVRLLVIAKDVWSLRLNSDFRFKGGVLEYLFLQPSEENLLGTHRAVAAQFTLKRDTISAGGRLIDPRVADSRYRFVLDGNVIVNRKSGEAEGSFGFFQYGVPLYSLAQKWSHGAVVEWRREVTRRWDYERGRLATFDATATAQEDAIPYVYSTDDLYGRASVTRSFGLDVKHDVQVGVEASREAYRTDALGSFDPAAVAEFRAEVVPVSETRIDPYVQYHLHTSSFARLLDVDTLALQEDYRLGPELYLRFYPVAAALGSSRDLLGWHGEAAYTHELAGGLVRAVLAPTLELDLGAGRVTDSELHGQLHVASPRVLVGRFVYDGLVLLRPHNYLNRRVSLGGDGRLRGYPSQKFWGENAVASNLEFRTSPLQLWTVQLAGALFYDAGDAFDGPDELSPKQGAGLGLRLLFPQLERAVMRIDWGFALGPWSGRVLDGLVLTFRQGFGTPAPTGRGVVEGS